MMEVARVHRIFYGKVINRGKFKQLTLRLPFFFFFFYSVLH